VLGKRCFIFLLISILLLPSFFVVSSNGQIVENSWIDSIQSYAYDVDVNTTAEIVVCVFTSLYGHGIKDNSGNEINDIVNLGVYVFNNLPLDVTDGTQTGIGKKGKDNGVLVLVALNERQWRIEVGYGLEGDITDIESNLIAQEYLVPAFQQGDYGQGLYDTVIALGEKIPADNNQNTSNPRGTYYYESDNQPVETHTPFWDWNFYGMPLWLIVVLVLLSIIFPVFGGKVRGGRSGGGGSTGKW
jgi:uncharacterized protein